MCAIRERERKQKYKLRNTNMEEKNKKDKSYEEGVGSVCVSLSLWDLDPCRYLSPGVDESSHTAEYCGFLSIHPKKSRGGVTCAFRRKSGTVQIKKKGGNKEVGKRQCHTYIFIWRHTHTVQNTRYIHTRTIYTDRMSYFFASAFVFFWLKKYGFRIFWALSRLGW